MATFLSDGGEVSRPALHVISYDTARFDFRAWAQSALSCEDLSQLHRKEAPAPQPANDRWLRARFNTALLKSLPRVLAMLTPFIADELGRYFDGAPEVRHPPLFRIHLPGSDSISPFHRDSDYGLASGAINVWVPLTRVWGTNSLWLESVPGRADFSPVELDYGQALIFDAVRLTHGSRLNDTDSTRVSFDFRCHGRLRDSLPSA